MCRIKEWDPALKKMYRTYFGIALSMQTLWLIICTDEMWSLAINSLGAHYTTDLKLWKEKGIPK